MKLAASRAIVFAVLILCSSIVATGGTVAEPSGGHGENNPIINAALGDISITAPGDIIATAAAVSDDEDEEAENETKRHENPDNSSEDGDLGGVESWLSGRLAGQLGDSAIQLSEGEYEFARKFIGEEYRNRLGQYVDVTGEIGSESAEDTFRAARDEQESLTRQVENYRETREAYEEALEEGDTERARELARELNEIARDIDETSENLRKQYGVIEEQTGENLSDADAAIEELNQEIQLEQVDIQAAEFTETALVVEAEQETISFLNPLTATGRLRTINGDPVSNESVRLTVGNETIQTETDADGMFAFEYRPTDLPLSTSSLSVRYVPDNQSVYLGSEANVDISVEQVKPSIIGLSAPDEVAYGDSVTINGNLTVENVPVDGVPLEVIADGQQIGTVQVSDGSFDGTVVVPASILDGEQSLLVRLAFEDRALAGVSETRAVTVRETDTNLSVTATQVGKRKVEVDGVLETVNGKGVNGEPVQVSIDGTTVATVMTTGDGEFAETITVPDTVEYGERLVSASYRGADSNLGPTGAEATVEIEPWGNTEAGGGGQNSDTETGLLSSSDGDDETLSVILVIGGVGLLLILTLLWWARNHTPDDLPFSDTPIARVLIGAVQRFKSNSDGGSTQVESGTPVTGEEQEISPSPTASLLQHASDHLQSGRPDVAVQACYSAVRQTLEARIGATEALTHWEFYQRYRETNETGSTADESFADALREVTEEYERATFSGEDTSPDSAQRALERAQQLCRVDDVESSNSPSIADD